MRNKAYHSLDQHELGAMMHFVLLGREQHLEPRLTGRLRAFRHPRSLGHGLVRPFRGSHRLFTVRRGKVRAVSIASSRTIKRRALLRRYLRAASSA